MAHPPFVRSASRNLRSAGKDLNAMLSGHSALLPRRSLFSRNRDVPTRGLAVGALAGGAMAIGALVIARLAIGKMAIGHVRLSKVEVDELTVHRLRVTEGAEGLSFGEGAAPHSAGAERFAAINAAEVHAGPKRSRSPRKRDGAEQSTAADTQPQRPSSETD